MNQVIGTQKPYAWVEKLLTKREIEYEALSEESDRRWRVVLDRDHDSLARSTLLIAELHPSIVVENVFITTWSEANDGFSHHVIFFFKD